MPTSPPKPPLHPLRRVVPPPPAASAYPSDPFPPARLIPLSGHGPEDVVVDERGRLLCGLDGGRIVRIDLADGSETTLADTGGRPLGLDVTPDGRILVCDAKRGLLRVDPAGGEIEVLVRDVGGVPLRFCSNAVAAKDGTIWFTESTDSFDFETYRGSLLEHRPSGRLFRRDTDGRVDVVLNGLYFANGVALSEDENTLFFAETGDYAIGKIATNGPQAGKRHVVIRNLPGFPDNLSRIGGGRIWVALASGRNKALDDAGTLPGFVRQIVWRLPDRFQPQPQSTTWAIAFDESGTIVRNYHAERDDFAFVTGVAESGGQLYLASVGGGAILALTL